MIAFAQYAGVKVDKCGKLSHLAFGHCHRARITLTKTLLSRNAPMGPSPVGAFLHGGSP